MPPLTANRFRGAEPLETALKPALLSRTWSEVADVGSLTRPVPHAGELPRPPPPQPAPATSDPPCPPARNRVGHGVWLSGRQAGDAPCGEKWGPGRDLAQEMDCPPAPLLPPRRRRAPDRGRIHRPCPEALAVRTPRDHEGTPCSRSRSHLGGGGVSPRGAGEQSGDPSAVWWRLIPAVCPVFCLLRARDLPAAAQLSRLVRMLEVPNRRAMSPEAPPGPARNPADLKLGRLGVDRGEGPLGTD